MLKRLGLDGLEVTGLSAYGGVLLLLMGLGYGASRLHAHVDTRTADTAVAVEELESLRTLQDTQLWTERHARSEALRASREERVWADQTLSLVSARLQAFIRRVGDANGFENFRVAVEQDAVTVSDVSLLRFTVSGRVEDTEALAKALEALETFPARIELTEVALSFNPNRRSNLRIQGQIPVSLPGPEGERT